MPAGLYALPSWGVYFQTGPVRIRAEQGAIFDGQAANDWTQNPLTDLPALNNFRFLQFQQIGGTGSTGPLVDIEGLTFFRWTQVLRQSAVTHSNVIPLFRLSRCRFEECFRGVVTFLNAPAMYDRIEITYNTFYKCNVGISWEGSRWQNVLVHGNYADFCAREGIRFGSNTLTEQGFWNRVIFSFNCVTRIGMSALGGLSPVQNETNETHCLRDYSQYVMYTGNICYDCSAGPNSNDSEIVYTKSRYTSASGNIFISPDGFGDSRALLTKKGQTRTYTLDPNASPVVQTQSYSNIYAQNIFIFLTEKGTCFFTEGGDYLLVDNWFENGAGTGTSGGVVMHGTNDVGNLDQICAIKGNVFRTCSGWLLAGGIKGGTFYFDDNVINSGPNAADKHLGIVTMQSMDATPSDTIGYGAVGTTYYVRRNSGDAGTQTDVFCKSDQAAHVLTAIVEANSLVGVVKLVDTANNPMLRVDIIDNDLNGSTTAQLIGMNQIPKRFRLRDNRNLKRATSTSGALIVQQLVMPANAVGVIKYKLLGRSDVSSANAYYGEVTQGIFANGLFGTADKIEFAQGTLTAGRATITQSAANININIVPGVAANFVWDVDIDAYYEAP